MEYFNKLNNYFAFNSMYFEEKNEITPATTA